MLTRGHIISICISVFIVAGILLWLKLNTVDTFTNSVSGNGTYNFTMDPIEAYNVNQREGYPVYSEADDTDTARIRDLVKNNFSEFIGKSIGPKMSSSPSSVEIMNQVIETLNSATSTTSTTSSSVFSLIQQGPFKSNPDGSVVLDAFIYNKTMNYVAHMIFSISSNGIITDITFPDLANSAAKRVRGEPVKGKNYSTFNINSENPDDNTDIIQGGITASTEPLDETANYLCFGSVDVGAKTKSECESYGGKWDKPVDKNEDCPYYKFGSAFGVNNGGYCKLPRGLQLVGYRYVSTAPGSEALCYKCHKTLAEGESGSGIDVDGLGHCCEDQKNSSLYPELNGIPAYAV